MIKIPKIQEKIKAELCKRDFYFFIKEFWEQADTSIPVWNWHIEYLSNTLQEDIQLLLEGKEKKSDIIINCPPGTSKSMIISVLLPAWILINKPTTRIITASYSNTIALELSMKTRNLMLSNKFIDYFPNIILKDDENTKSNYKTRDGGGRFVTSTGSNILGMHGDIIICDDVQNLQTIYSDVERKRVNDWVTGTLSTRKTDKLNSLMIFVQQRLHQLDLTNYLLSIGTYKHIVLPGYLNDCLKPNNLKEKYINGFLDVDRLNEKALNQLKTMLGSKNYNAQILQNPDNDEDSIIKKEWLDIIDINYFLELIKDKKIEYEYFLDTAYGGKDADFNVILECFKMDNQLYITNLYRSKEEFPDLIKSIKRVVQKSNKIYLEGKASGKSIIQQLKNDTNLNIIEIQPKDSKIVRLNAISPIVEGRRVKLLNGSWNNLLIDEVTSNYPPNDDIRDVFCYAVDEKLIKGSTYGKYTIL